VVAVEAVALAIIAAGVGYCAWVIRRLNAALVATAARLHLQQVAIDGFRGDLGDIRRKQDEVLCEVTKYRDDVKQLLKDIRDLNNTELTERKEILSRTNITGTSRVTSMRAWVANLETAAEKELIGLGSDR